MVQFNRIEFPYELKARFNSYITTSFDDSMTVEMQLRVLIQWIKKGIELTNEQSEFIEKFDKEFTEKINNFIIEVQNDLENQNNVIESFKQEVQNWIDNFETWVKEQGLEQYIQDALNELEESGRFSEMILKATELFGDIATFRPFDKLIIDKIKNEFSERGGINIKEFGVIADGVTDDTLAFQKALDSGVDLIFPEGEIIYITDTLYMTKDVQYLAYNTTIKTDKPLDPMLWYGAKKAPFYVKDTRLEGKLVLDGQLIAKTGLKMVNIRADIIDGVEVFNCVNKQFEVTRDRTNTTNDPSLTQVELHNVKALLRSPYDYNTMTDIDPIGFSIDADDCFFTNLYGVHQTTFIQNKGNNTFIRGHAWLLNKDQIKKSIFFDCYNGSDISHFFADTYATEYYIRKQVDLRLTSCRDFANQSFYPLNSIAKKELAIPTVFYFENSDSKNSTIRATNSNFNGLIDGGGYLTNSNEYNATLKFVNCTQSNLYNTTLTETERFQMTENWEHGTIISTEGLRYTPKKDQIASVTIQPLTVYAEDMSGDFLEGNGRWYKKNSNASLTYANNILTVDGTGSIKFGCGLQNQVNKTVYFIRYRIKCTKNVVLKVVNQLDGVSVAPDHIIEARDGWHEDCYIFEFDQQLNPLTIEFNFDVQDTTGTNKIELTELTLFDVMKQKIGYMFETMQDLSDRLMEIGYVLKSRTLPIPENQDFIIKSIPVNYGCRIIANEYSSLYDYTAYRTLEGLVVTGKTGNNPYKKFIRVYGLDQSARYRGSVKHFTRGTIKKLVTTQSFPSSNVFSDDIKVDGVWNSIHFWYKDKVKSTPITRSSTKISYEKLLSSNENIAGNSFIIEEDFVTSLSNPVVYSTPYMKKGAGYFKLPLFKDGSIIVQSGGGGFVGVEVLVSE